MEINAANENSSHEAHWQQLAPVLNDALNHLGARDRDAIILRYLQSRDLKSIGLAIGTSEDAAQKRIARGLEKLRRFLAGRGVTFSSAMLVAALDAGAKMPVPTGLAATISAAALSGAAAAKTGLTLSTIKTMITSKLSLTTAAALAVASVTAIVINDHPSLAADSSAPAQSSEVASNTTADAAKSATEPAAPSGETASPSSAVPSQPAPGTSPANASPTSEISSVTIDEPNSGLSESHSTTVRVSKGIVTKTTNDNGTVRTATQAVPVSGIVSGSDSNSSFTVGSGAAAANIFPMPTGDPISSRVNPDGSTTSTYANPQGGTLQIVVSADGKSRSMKIISLGPKSN